MKWGFCALLLIIILIISIIIYILSIKSQDNFLAIDNTLLLQNLNNSNTNTNNKPVDINFQTPVAANQLTDEQLQSIDSDVLRNVRVLANFSMTDEFDFYQIYTLIKKLKDNTYTFTYIPVSDDNKTKIKSSEKLIAINSGAINTTDLELFSRIKLELISSFNSLIIQLGLYVEYHPYQFFKIINSNMISNKVINNSDSDKTNSYKTNSDKTNNYNIVFTLTFAREYKFQQFIIYYDLDLIANNSLTNTSSKNISTISYTIKINKVELIGIPIPKTIEFHSNQKTDLKTDSNSDSDSDSNIDYYYKDQVSENSTIDVTQSSEISSRFNNPNLKYIDITETHDMDNTMFDVSSLSTKMESRIMNVAKDQKFNNNKCYGLVNGVSKELPQYKNPIFCKSFHPDINQNGIWDSPCQVNNDCPFYKANKNYTNEFGKCDKPTGKCEMPMGIISLGYTKYGKMEPNCYNCGANSPDSKCCGTQSQLIKSGVVNYNSPDYVFTGDESYRKQFENDLKSVGLLVNPSI